MRAFLLHRPRDGDPLLVFFSRKKTQQGRECDRFPYIFQENGGAVKENAAEPMPFFTFNSQPPTQPPTRIKGYCCYFLCVQLRSFVAAPRNRAAKLYFRHFGGNILDFFFFVSFIFFFETNRPD